MKYLKTLLIILTVLLFFLATVWLLQTTWNRTNLDNTLKIKNKFGILLYTYDKENNKEIKFISAVIIQPKLHKLFTLGFYPETYFQVSDQKLINFQNLLTLKKDDEIRQYMQTLTNVEILYHLGLSIQDLSRLLDILEGINFFLANNQLLTNEILPQRKFILDGSLLPSFLHPESNLDLLPAITLTRYYSFFLSLWDYKKKYCKTTLTNQIFQIIYKYISSNLTSKEVQQLIGLICSNDTWEPIFLENVVQKESDKLVLDQKTTINNLHTSFLKSKESSTFAPFNYIQIIIQNGTKIHGLARHFRSFLNSNGIQVLEFSNADHHNYEHSILLDVSANNKSYNFLKNLLDIKHSYHNIDRSLFADAILILGNDYKTLKDE